MNPSDSYRSVPSWNGGPYSHLPHVPQTEYHAQFPQLPSNGFNTPGYPGSYPYPATMAPPHLHYNYPDARANLCNMVLERCSANDDILVSALLAAEKVGSPRSQAIEGMAVNGHGASSSWFAYYVDRRQYFDEMVAEAFDQFLETQWAKNPELRSQSTSKAQRQRSRSLTPELGPSRNGQSLPDKRKTRRSAPYPPPSSSRTSNARTGSSRFTITIPSSSGRQSVVRHNDLRPGEPAPPSRIKRDGRGTLFTSEDKQYIVDYCNWEIRQDPSQTRQVIFEKIAKKAPHHSTATWDRQAGRDIKVAEIFKRRSSKDQSSSTRTAPHHNSRHGGNDKDSDSDVQIISDSDSSKCDDGRDMFGNNPARYTEGEDKIIVNWITQHSEAEWDQMSTRERWEPMLEKMPGRTLFALGARFTREKIRYTEMAKKLRSNRT